MCCEMDSSTDTLDLKAQAGAGLDMIMADRVGLVARALKEASIL